MNERTIHEIAERVSRKIAPMWPLKNFVAVNPYLGFTDVPFAETADILSRRGGIRMTMPLAFYLAHFEKGSITREDLAQALAENGRFEEVDSFLHLSLSSLGQDQAHAALQTVVDLVPGSTAKTLHTCMVDSLSDWMASYFDRHQAIWSSPNAEGIYSAWRRDATVDLNPELSGVRDFRKTIASLPAQAEAARKHILQQLGLTSAHLESYLHTLLLKMSGWASFVAGEDWNNRLYASESHGMQDLLQMLLSWEYAVYVTLPEAIRKEVWPGQLNAFLDSTVSNGAPELTEALIWQDAFDLAHQRTLIGTLNRPVTLRSKEKPKAQAVFCIDVRSEVIRRHIEGIDPEIETAGFAGFFGAPLRYKSVESDAGKNQCPVLIPSGIDVRQSFQNETEKQAATEAKKTKDQWAHTLKYFRGGAVSAYSFVSPLGLSYLPRLLKSTFAARTNGPGLSGKSEDASIRKAIPLDLLETSLETRAQMAAALLRMTGLKDNLAALVCIIGHGSTSRNNPHASGLECGACGGHSGEINALTAAQNLNDPMVREALSQMGLHIPLDTRFVAGLHDTTSDHIYLYAEDHADANHLKALEQLSATFARASENARKERNRRFYGERVAEDDAFARGADWSHVRPEYGLAGCSSFIIAPRIRTENRSLEGSAFLHNYNWKDDVDGSMLETIMTAPMVVTSWINLQYYASVTDNARFGAGNKTLHNVTSGLGVVEGAGGDLRTGLPLQSLHDGTEYKHLPKRLCVCIEAPISTIHGVLDKHPEIQQLFDNEWLSLFQIGSSGKVENKYHSAKKWLALETAEIHAEHKLQIA